jgi:hypothetical protein
LCCLLLFFSITLGKRGVYIPSVAYAGISYRPYYKNLLQNSLLKNDSFVFTFLLSAGLTIFALMGLFSIPAVSKLVSKIEIEPWYFLLVIGAVGTPALFILRGYCKWFAWPIFKSVLWMSYSTCGYVLRNDISTPISVYQKV